MLWLRLAAHSRMGEVPQQNYMAVFAIPGPEFQRKHYSLRQNHNSLIKTFSVYLTYRRTHSISASASIHHRSAAFRRIEHASQFVEFANDQLRLYSIQQ